MPAGFPDKYTQLWGHTPVGEVVDDDSVLPAGITVDSPLEEAIQYALENAGGAGSGGDSAYQVAVDEGFVGDETAWLASLVGADGTDGADGTNGTQGAQGPVGATGATGAAGPGLPSGGTAGQIAAKASGTDYDTGWVDNIRPHVFIDDYPTSEVTGQDATVVAAAFAWCLATHPGADIVFGPKQYLITATLDISGLSGQCIRGQGEATRITGTGTKDFPLLTVGGIGQSIERVRLDYGGATPPVSTAAAAIYCDASWNNSRISQVRILNTWHGLHVPSSSTFFSNEISSLRVGTWDGWAILQESSGTGNVFNNVFLNSPYGGDADGCIKIRQLSEGVFNQLNLEAAECTGPAMIAESCSLTINGLHIEDVEVPDDTGFVFFDTSTAGRSNIVITSGIASRLAQPSGRTNAIFHVADGDSVASGVDSQSILSVLGFGIRDNNGTVLGTMHEFMGDGGGSDDAVINTLGVQRQSGHTMAAERFTSFGGRITGLETANTSIVHNLSGQFRVDNDEIHGWGYWGPDAYTHANSLGTSEDTTWSYITGGLVFPHDVRIKRLYVWHANSSASLEAWGWVLARHAKTAASTAQVTVTRMLDEVGDNASVGPRDYVGNKIEVTDITTFTNDIIPAGEVITLGVDSPSTATDGLYVRVSAGYLEFERV